MINGQKIWTSGAHRSNWGWLAARTDPDAPKHKGMSMFLVPMDAPGITIRPLVNMAGQHGFNEVFFEDVRIPANIPRRAGEPGLVPARRRARLRALLDRRLGARPAHVRGGRDASLREQGVRTRQRSRRCGTGWRRSASRSASRKYLSYRVASLQQAGKIPNYEATIAKLYSSELGQRLSRTASSCWGCTASFTRRASTRK